MSPREVHLQQPELGDRLHGVLRHRHAVLVALRRTLQRHVVAERVLGDDDPSRVRAHVARHAFETPRGVDELAQFLVLFVRLLHLRRLLERKVYRHPHPLRHEPRDAVHVCV